MLHQRNLRKDISSRTENRMMRNRKRYTKAVGGLLGISAVLGFLVLAVILGRMNTAHFEKRLVVQTQAHLQAIAKTESRHIERCIVDMYEELTVLAENPRVKEALISGWTDKDEPAVDGYFPEELVYTVLMKNIDSLYRLDNNGTVQIRRPWRQGKTGNDYSHKPDVKMILEDHRPYVTGLFETDSGVNCISVCVPVFEEEQFIGILRAVMNLDVIGTCLKDSDIGSNGYAWIMDDKGTVISHPETRYSGTHLPTALKGDVPSYDWSELQTITERMANGEEGTGVYGFVSPINGRLKETDQVTAFIPIRVINQRWSLGVVIDYDDISGPIQDHTRNVTGGVALLLLAFLGAGSWFYRVQKEKDRLRTEADSAKKLRLTNVVMKHEIAERRQAEEKLLDSEKRNRAYLEYSPVCTKIVDLDFNLQYMSRAGIEALQIVDITEFHGKPYPLCFFLGLSKRA